MSDIELVIKIPEGLYKVISEDEYGVHQGKIYEIIRNGTPLDKIRKQIELEKLGYPPSAGYFKAIIKVLQIIDKCVSESEDQNDVKKM